MAIAGIFYTTFYQVAAAADFRSFVCEKAIDGDTIRLRGEGSVRLAGINTPERGEEGYAEAKKVLSDLVAGKKVELDVIGRDAYGRPIAFVYVRIDGQRVDVNAEMVKRGMAHAFFIENERPGMYERYITLQNKAKTGNMGIWRLARYRGSLHITSFHANGRGNDRLDPNVEYFRMANIGREEIDLSNYFVLNCATGKKYPLPPIKVKPGEAVKVMSGRGQNHGVFASGMLRVYMGNETEIWEDKGAKLIIVDKNGVLVDEKASRKTFSCVYQR